MVIVNDMGGIGVPELIIMLVVGLITTIIPIVVIILAVRWIVDRKMKSGLVASGSCQHCGQRVPDIGTFCPLCGQRNG